VRDAVGRLIERGHAEERPNPDDRRSTLVVLTAAGRDIFDRGLPLFHRVLADLDAELDGTLREHEDAVRSVRLALQKLSARASR
jgi:DNA-binding MarR family transcriptional regulator